ncbi:hypothetical protein [Methylomonas sp. AM2-LC]|uniref:hypothetical protein n=1 Tax=Methylomonas sp. AM2-LC TaxID=3153301 RepID=UPI0032644E69
MSIALPFNFSKPIAGEASISIETPIQSVFNFIAIRFFENYPKWAAEVSELHCLDGEEVYVGAKAKQIRDENGSEVESIFEITELEPNLKLVLSGISSPYKQCYQLNNTEESEATQLTFRFELLELEVFMRPFEKLIRYAIEEGAENTVENIRQLILLDAQA